MIKHLRTQDIELIRKKLNEKNCKLIFDDSFVDEESFDKINNFLNTLNNKNRQSKYHDFYTFIEEKELSVIIKDIMDLQKLLPGLSVPIIRPNYLDDAQL